MKAHFSYSAKGLPFAVITLTYRERTLELDALVDSGSTVNVLLSKVMPIPSKFHPDLLSPRGALKGQRGHIFSCYADTVLSGLRAKGHLRLNNPLAVTVRRNWVKAGWHPPQKA